MATREERTALGFLAAIAVMGAVVRAVGVERFESEVVGAEAAAVAAPLAERALAAQIAAIDSVRAAPPKKRAPKARPAKAPSSPRDRQPTLVPRDGAVAPIDINSANAEELDRLPRIGPALARRIISWREEHGPFSSMEDLRHVRGIGPSTVRLLEPLVTFSGGHRPLLSEGSPSVAYQSTSSNHR